jgi:hypothetical protein
MTLRDWLARLSPWAVITIAGCATLALVDVWRDLGPTAVPLIRGTLPNLVAVLTLAFGALMVRFPERQSYSRERAAVQNRWFWSLWAGAIGVTVTWEFAQRSGRLVFDPLDLAATAVGAAAAAALYVFLRRLSFRPTA